MLYEFCIKDQEQPEGVVATPDICYRAAAIGVIGSANFALLVMGQQDVRAQSQFTEDVSPVDGYAALLANKETKEVEDDMHDDQGGVVKMPNKERGAYMHRIINILNSDLEAYADRIKIEHPKTGKTIIMCEPFHVGQPLSVALAKMIDRTPAPPSVATRAKADALGVTEAEMRESDLRAAAFQSQFLKLHKAEVLEMVWKYTHPGVEALELDTVFDKLPAIDRLRLMVAADNGLYFRRRTDAERYIKDSRQEDLLSNVGAYDAARKLLHIRIDDFCKEPAIKRELMEARTGGDKIPALRGLIVPIKREEAKKTA
jgi:hypothetical protein